MLLKNIGSLKFLFWAAARKCFTHFHRVKLIFGAENIRIGLLTEHVTISEVHKYITVDGIMSKLKMMHASLQQDFSIDKPKIAVLGLNPHAGDEGLIGKEELEIIKPAIAEARKNS